MKEPPIGRIGYVMDGLGDGRSASGGPEVRCNNCRGWFPRALSDCPDCGHPRPGFNVAIRTGQLNRQLYEQAGLRTPSNDFRA